MSPSTCVVWGWPWSSLYWSHLNFQPPWILSNVFPRTPILFLELCHIAPHLVVALWLLVALAVDLWLLLLLLLLLVLAVTLVLFFPLCLSVSPVHIPYSPSSCYTIKKQFHVHSAVFLQVHLMLLPRVLIQRCVILKLYFSKMNSSFINFWEVF